MIKPKQIFNLLAPVVRRLSLVLVFGVIITSVSGIYTYTRTLAPEHAYAATSSNLNFQARLLTSSGNTVPDGYYNIEFKLYSVSSGGSALWTETYYDSNGVTAGNDNRLRVAGGYLSANLGSITALPNIDWSQDLWLSMNVGGSTQTATPTYDGEMTPRVKLTAVPYALAAGNVRSANTSTGSTNSDGVSVTTGAASGATSNTGTITLQTGNSTTSGNTGAITLTTGNATSGNSGNITLDVGTASGTTGTISVGTANTSGITIGRVGVLTRNDGNFTIGASAGSGTLLINNGATLNATLAVGNDSDGGALGGTPGSPLTAAQTVDIYTTIAINQTTAGQDITLPNPTLATAGRVLYILNSGSVSFTMHSVTIPAGYGQLFIWNGSAWKLAAAGGGAAITLQAGYDGGNTITSTNARNFSFTSADTATDANFIFNAATGSTGAFKVQANGSDVLSIGATGQLALSVQGNTGGLSIGGDTNLYRSNADQLRTDDNFLAASLGAIYTNPNIAVFGLYVNGENYDRLSAMGTGELLWSDGTNSADTNLYRSAANTLRTDDSLVLQGSLSAMRGSDYSTTGNLDDVNFGSVSLVRLTGASTQTVRGVAGGTDGRILTIVNAAAQTAYIANDDTNSAAANRILTGTGGTLTVPAGSSIILIYDSGATRWRIVGGAAAASTGAGAPFVQGGNSFGVAGDLGTNDNFNLNFRTNNATRATLTTAGQLQIAGTGSAAGLLLGGDANLYRSAADVLSTDDLFTAPNFAINGARDGGVSNQITVSSVISGPALRIKSTDATNNGTIFDVMQGTNPVLRVENTSATTGIVEIGNVSASTDAGGLQGGLAIKRATANPTSNPNAATLIYTAQAAGTLPVDSLAFRAGSSTLAVDTSNDRLLFGSAGDTNLYRAAANTLQTDDDFKINNGSGGVASPTATGRLLFDNTYDTAGNSTTNKILLFDDGATFRAGIGVSTNSVNYFSGGGHAFYTDHLTEASPGFAVFTLADATGAALFKSGSSNSTTAFQIQNTASASILTVDTSTSSNLITNGGVEGGGTTGWTAKGTATLTQSSSHQWQGNNSLSVAASTGSDDGAKYTYTMTNSQQYTLSLWAKVASGSITDINIGHRNTSAGADNDCLTGQTITTSWTRFTCTFTATSPDATGYIYINKTGGSSETFFIDGVQLETGATATSFNPGGAIQLAGIINSPTTFQNKQDSTAAFQIQNAAGTSNLLVADTVNTRVGIGASPATSLLTVGTNTTTAAGGLTFGTDTNLYRGAADSLKTDDNLYAVGALAANWQLTNQIALAADGKIYLGNALDTNLYRSAANVLASDDGIISNYAGANQVALGFTASGVAGPGLVIGSTADTNLYRSAADILMTDDNLTVALDLAVNGADITTTSTGTATLFNTNAVTLNIGGAATAAGGGINFAGGSGSTGCSIDGSTGNLSCSGTITGSGGTGFINNSTSLQTTANFNIQARDSGVNGTVGGIIRGAAAGQTVDLLQLQNTAGGVVANIDADGDTYAAGLYVNRRYDQGTPNGGIYFINAAGNAYVRGIYYDHNSGNVTIGGTGGTSALTVNTASGITQVVSSNGTEGFKAVIGSGTTFSLNDSTSGNAGLFLQASASSQVGQIIKARASQTADLTQFQNSSGSVVSNFTASGALQGGNASGTNVAGTNLYLNGGAGTGTGTPGGINFQYYSTTGSGATLQSTLNTACTISGTNGSFSCPGAGSNSERFGGSSSTSTYVNALAVGRSASVTNDNGTALGYNSNAGNESVSVGGGSVATGTSSVSLGYGAAAANTNTIAIGRGASTSTFTDSIVIGRNMTATANGQLVLGAGIQSVYIGNGVTNAAPNALSMQSTGSSTAGTAGAAFTLQGGAGATTTTGSAGGALSLLGGNAGGTAGGAGGAITLQAGTSSGTNQAGATTTIASGISTGNAVGGDILFRYSTTGASGSAANSLQTACSISGTTGSLSCNGTGGATSERFGASALSGGVNSVGLGNAANATSNGSIAIGGGAVSGISGSSFAAIAIGQGASATGHESIAIGNAATANANLATSVGAATSNLFQGSISLGYGATTTATNQLVIGSSTGSASIQNVYIGNGVTAAAPTGFTLQGTGSSTAGTAGATVTIRGGAGTTTGAGSTGGVLTLQAGTAGGANIAGANTVINGGQGTGTGVGGNILFQYAAAGGAGSSANTLQTACVISGTNGSFSCPGAGASSERFGAGSTAAGGSAVAVGATASAGAVNATAVGYGSSAASSSSLALGFGAQAGGISIGYQANSTASTNSIALGYQATTTAANQIVIGSSAIPINTAIIGNGVTNTAPGVFTLQGTGSSTAGTAGAAVSLRSGAGTTTGAGSTGGVLTLQAGDAGGTNVAGANTVVSGGQGTGTANGGNILFQIADPGASGASLNSLAAVFSLSGATGAALFQNSTNSTTAFQIQNSSGNEILTADTSSNKIILGKASTLSGSLEFKTSAGANSITVSAPATISASYNLKLPETTPSTGLCLITSQTDSSQLTFGSCFQQVTNAPITHVTGWSNNGTNTTTVSVSPSSPGDLLVLGVGYQNNQTVTGVSGGGVTSWQKITASCSGSGTTKCIELWRGVVTTTGASTVTLTYSGNTGTTDIAVDQYTMNNAFGTWSVDSSSTQFNSGSATVTYPTLTPQANNELYTGYGFVANTPASAGATSGFTYRVTTGTQGVVAYKTATTSGVALSPTASQASSGNSLTIAATIVAFANNNVIVNSVNSQDANFYVIAGSSGTVAGTLQANAGGTANILNIKDGAGAIVGSFGYQGAVLFKNSTDSTTAFRVQDASSRNYLLVNTSGASISVGDVGIASTIQVGNTTGAVSQTINIGTNATASATNVIHIGDAATATNTITMGSSSNSANTLTLEGGTGASAIQIGNGATAHGIQIGSNATGDNDILLGGANAGSTLILEGGTGASAIQIGNGATAHGIQIGTGAAVQTIVVGSTNSTSALTLQAGTGLLNIGNDTVAKTTTINIGADATGADLVALGSAHTSSTVILEGGTGASAIQIGNGATAHGIQIGTGAAVQTLVLGSNNSTSSTLIQGGSGTGSITLNASGTGGTTGTIVNTDTNSTAAFQVQNASATTVLGVNTVYNASNLVTNGGFETNTTGWAAKGAVTAFGQSTAQSFRGTGSITFTSDTSADDGVKYNLTLTNGTQYAFSFCVYASSATANFRVGYYNGTTETNSPNDYPVSNLGWNCYTYVFTPGASSGTPYIYLKSTSGTSGRVHYIDAVSITANSSTGVLNPLYQESSIKLDGVINSPVTLQNSVDSSAAFVVNSAEGNRILTVDATNEKVGIGVIPGTATGLGILQVGFSGATTAAQGISFGGDTVANLYRSAAGDLKTDGDLNIGANLNLSAGNGSNARIYEDGSILLHTTGSTGIFVGRTAGNLTTTGTNNAALGYNAMNDVTTGSANVAVGDSALALNTTGSYNTAIGIGAGVTFNEDATVDGIGNTFIGAYAGQSTASTIQNSTAIGVNSVVSQSNSLVLGCLGGINDCSATTKVGIAVAAPTATLSLLQGTTAAEGIAFGTDTNLYRSGTGALETDSALISNALRVNDDGTGSGDITIYSAVNSSNQAIIRFNEGGSNGGGGSERFQIGINANGDQFFLYDNNNARNAVHVDAGNVSIQDSGGNTSIGNTTAGTATNIQAGTTGGINIGSVGAVTTGSTIHIADTSNATGTQTVVMGSTANTANYVRLQAGSATGANNGVQVRADGVNSFQIQSAAGTTFFNADTTNTRITIGAQTTTLSTSNLTVQDVEITRRIRIGTTTDGISFNDGTATKLRFTGTAQNAISVTLAPEFAGAVLTGDGSNNVGTMTSDFCSGTSRLSIPSASNPCAATEDHNYYSWTANATNDYDAWVKWKVPSDFSSFDSTQMQFYGWRTSTSDAVQVRVYRNGTLCDNQSISGTVSQWNLTTLTPTTSCNGGSAIVAGDELVFRISLSVGVNAEFARMGEIYINYKSAF